MHRAVWGAERPEMSDLYDYEVRFVDPQGEPIEDVALVAQCLAVAVECAGMIAPRLGAAHFYITSPSSRKGLKAEWDCIEPGGYAEQEPELVGFFSN